MVCGVSLALKRIVLDGVRSENNDTGRLSPKSKCPNPNLFSYNSKKLSDFVLWPCDVTLISCQTPKTRADTEEDGLLELESAGRG